MADTLFFLSIDFAAGRFGAGALKGESVASRFEDQIEIEDFRWGMNVKGNRKQAPGRTNPAANVAHKPLVLSAYFDTATTALIKHMKERTRFNMARLTVSHPASAPDDAAQLDVMEIELHHGFVEKVGVAASESGKSGSVKVTYELSYKSIDLDYYPAVRNRDRREKRTTFSATVSTPVGDE